MRTHTHKVSQFSHSVWPLNYWSSPAPVALLSHSRILNSWLWYICSISRINEGDSSEAVSTAWAERIFPYLKNRETLAHTEEQQRCAHMSFSLTVIISRQLKLLPALHQLVFCRGWYFIKTNTFHFYKMTSSADSYSLPMLTLPSSDVTSTGNY